MSRRERGSAILESVGVIPVLVGLTTWFFVLGYTGFAQAWLQLVADEMASCYLGFNKTKCVYLARDKITTALPFGRILVLRPTLTTSDRAQTFIQFSMLGRDGWVLQAEGLARVPGQVVIRAR